VLKPPSGLNAVKAGTTAQLSWAAAESGTQYYVYRGPSQSGPFARISPSPVTGTSFTDNAPPSKEKSYMVRAIKGVTVGTGSYTNISQGAFATLN